MSLPDGFDTAADAAAGCGFPSSYCRRRIRELTRDQLYFNEGSKAQDQQQWEKAIGFFTKAVELKGDNAMYLYHLAYCLQEVAPTAGQKELGYNKNALAHYQQVLKLNPNHHEAWYNLGYVQEELGRFADAVKSFKTALELRPNDKDALINLGNCYMEMDKFEDSVETYHEAIRLEPDCVMSHYNLASAHHSAAQQEQLKVSEALGHWIGGWVGGGIDVSYRMIGLQNHRPTN